MRLLKTTNAGGNQSLLSPGNRCDGSTFYILHDLNAVVVIWIHMTSNNWCNYESLGSFLENINAN